MMETDESDKEQEQEQQRQNQLEKKENRLEPDGRTNRRNNDIVDWRRIKIKNNLAE